MGEEAAISGAMAASSPRWLAKSHSRYDDEDDIQFSLPTAEDGAFLSIHFGQYEDDSVAAGSPLKSTFDKLNEELSSNKASRNRSLSFGRLSAPNPNSGLSLAAELQQHLEDQELESITNPDPAKQRPLIVVPTAFSTEASPSTNLALRGQFADPQRQPAQDESDDEESSISSHHPKDDSDSKKIEVPVRVGDNPAAAETLAESQQFGLVEKVKSFLFRRHSGGIDSAPEIQKVRKTSVYSRPSEIEETVEIQKEKQLSEYQISGGVAVERKMPSYNSFFYRPRESEMSARGGAGAGVQQATAATAMQTAVASPSQQQQSAPLTAALPQESASGGPPTKLRRPKPSRLREMNFWAPTSM